MRPFLKKKISLLERYYKKGKFCCILGTLALKFSVFEGKKASTHLKRKPSIAQCSDTRKPTKLSDISHRKILQFLASSHDVRISVR